LINGQAQIVLRFLSLCSTIVGMVGVTGLSPSYILLHITDMGSD